MEYRRFENQILVRMDPGDEVLDGFQKLCRKENIHLGDIRGLGASAEIDVSVFDPVKKQYFPQSIRKQSEITGLYGTITEKEGETYLHVHLQAMTCDGEAAGGHLNRCVIDGTLEAVVTVLDGHAGRTVNPLTGLNDIAFE